MCKGEKINRAPLRAISGSIRASLSTLQLPSSFHLAVAVNVTGNLDGPV